MSNQLNISYIDKSDLMSQFLSSTFCRFDLLRAEDSNIVCSFAFTNKHYTNKNIPKSITGGTL
jgi:hypothetical protein